MAMMTAGNGRYAPGVHQAAGDDGDEPPSAPTERFNLPNHDMIIWLKATSSENADAAAGIITNQLNSLRNCGCEASAIDAENDACENAAPLLAHDC